MCCYLLDSPMGGIFIQSYHFFSIFPKISLRMLSLNTIGVGQPSQKDDKHQFFISKECAY